jgi:hypothetical protein
MIAKNKNFNKNFKHVAVFLEACFQKLILIKQKYLTVMKITSKIL